MRECLDEIERLNAALLTAASILEQDGDEHSVGYALRCAMTPNVELTGSRAGSSPVSPATEGSEVERRVGGAVSPAPTFEKKGYGNENAA